MLENDIEVFEKKDKIILYHGSSGMLEGKFRHDYQKSGNKNDFGKGGYLGENLEQVQKYVINREDPHINKFLLDLSGLSCISLNGAAWAMTVLAHRGKFNEYPDIEKYFINLIDGYDVVVGPIADDNMFVALGMFFSNGLSDVGLTESLQLCNLGNQYTIKTDKATEHCNIVTVKKLETGFQKKNIAGIYGNKKERNIELAKRISVIASKTRKVGYTLDEIVENFGKQTDKFCHFKL